MQDIDSRGNWLLRRIRLTAKQSGGTGNCDSSQKAHKMGGVRDRAEEAYGTENEPEQEEQHQALRHVPARTGLKTTLDPKVAKEAIVDTREPTEKRAGDIKLAEIGCDRNE